MRPLWLMLGATLLSSAAQAAPLTYSAALQRADDAPALQAKAADVTAARAAAVAAGRLPDPKLRFGLDNFPVSGPPAWRFGPEAMTMATVGVMQDVPNGAKRRAERERASADISAAKSGEAVEARNVRLAAGLAWVDLYYAQRKLAALEGISAALKPLHDAAPAQLAAGSGRPATALEADELTAALGDRRAELLAAAGKARAELTRWTGEAEPEAIGAPPPQDVDAPSLRAALDRHPALLAYQAMGRQAAAELAAARADKQPDWSWELAYHRRDPMWGDMVSLGGTVSLPIFPGKRQDPTIAAKAASVGRVSAEREAMRRQLRAQLDADLADHAMHHDRMMRAQGTLVPLARRKADLETASYGAASASLSDVLQAFLGLAQARVDALDREAEVVRDAVRINLTYGAGEP